MTTGTPHQNMEQWRAWLAALDIGDVVCYRAYGEATKLTIGRLTASQFICTNNQRFNRETGLVVGRREYSTIVPWTEEHTREAQHKTLLYWLKHRLPHNPPTHEQLIAMKAAYDAAVPVPVKEGVTS